MALELPRFLQTKQYSAKALRAILLDSDLQTGVVNGTDLMAVQRGAGANMSVDVGAGSGWVKGTSTARQGLYNFYNDATVNVAIAAANATNPRIDQIIARVYDSTDGGSAQDIAAIEVVTGTATAGATLANRTGAGALPAHSFLLADVLVGAAVSSITNANIRDRRPFARGAFNRIVRTSNAAAGNDYAIAQGTVTELDPTNLKMRMECSGAPVRVSFLNAHGFNNLAAANTLYAGVWIDGANPDGAGTGEVVGTSMYQSGGSGVRVPLSFSLVLQPSAGSHVFSIVAFSGGTSASILCRSFFPLEFVVEELPRQVLANNSVTTG